MNIYIMVPLNSPKLADYRNSKAGSEVVDNSFKGNVLYFHSGAHGQELTARLTDVRGLGYDLVTVEVNKNLDFDNLDPSNKLAGSVRAIIVDHPDIAKKLKSSGYHTPIIHITQANQGNEDAVYAEANPSKRTVLSDEKYFENLLKTPLYSVNRDDIIEFATTLVAKQGEWKSTDHELVYKVVEFDNGLVEFTIKAGYKPTDPIDTFFKQVVVDENGFYKIKPMAGAYVATKMVGETLANLEILVDGKQVIYTGFGGGLLAGKKDVDVGPWVDFLVVMYRNQLTNSLIR